MNLHYVLDGHAVKTTDDIFEWGRAFEKERHVGQDTIGEASVSTVFLGVDHNFGHGRPLLFETMIFGGPHDQETWRYSTWNEAAAGHASVVARLQAGQAPDEDES